MVHVIVFKMICYIGTKFANTWSFGKFANTWSFGKFGSCYFVSTHEISHPQSVQFFIQFSFCSIPWPSLLLIEMAMFYSHSAFLNDFCYFLVFDLSVETLVTRRVKL